MIERILTDAVGQVPGLVVLVVLVVVFMRHLKSRDLLLKDISERCHELQDRAYKLIEKATVVIDKNTETIGACTERLRQMNGDKE